MKKSKWVRSSDMALNITSLMDVLTILLIFLLVNFSTQEQEVDPPKDIELPQSTSEKPIKLAVKMSISRSEVRIEDRVVMKLAAGKIRSSDLDKDKRVPILMSELQREKARLQSGARTEQAGREDDREDEIVYFEAEKGTPYETIDRILKTAAGAGFTKFRLVVDRKA